jgi:hypothetical protein
MKKSIPLIIILLLSFTIVYPQTNTWEGDVSHTWSTPGNWSLNAVPTASHNVVIPSGVPNYCYVTASGGYNAYCNSIQIQSGARLRIGYATVEVDYDVNNYGELWISSSNAILDVNDDFFWRSGSTNLGDYGTIEVAGDWSFLNGTSCQLGANNTVVFNGSSHQHIICTDNDAEFGNVIVEQTSTNALWLNSSCTEEIYISGYLEIKNSNILQVESEALVVDGTIDVNPGGQLYLEDLGGSLVNNSGFDLEGELNIDGGGFLLNGDFELKPTGILTIESGSFVQEISSYITGFGGEFNLSGTGVLTIKGSLIIMAGSDMNISGGTIQVEGNFDVNGSNLFQPSGGTLELIGDPTQSLECHSTDGNYLYNLTIDKSSLNDTYINGPTEVKNDFLLNAGDFRLTSGSSSHVLEIGGDWTNNEGPGNFNEGQGKVIFSGSGQSLITTNETFYDLEINKTSTAYNAVDMAAGITIQIQDDLDIADGCIEMNSNSILDINDDLTISAGAGLNASVDINLNIYIAGHWVDYNSTYSTIYGFNPGTSSTVTFDRSGIQIVGGSSTTKDFYNLIIDGGSLNLSDALKILGDFTQLSGGIYNNSTNLNHIFYGDITILSGTFQLQQLGGTTTFTGSMTQTLDSYDWYSFKIEEMIIDKPSNSVIISGDGVDLFFLTIDDGTLSLSSFMFYGNTEVNNGGTFSIGPGATITSQNITVKNGAVIEFLGSSGNEATANISGTVNIESGAEIGAEYANFNTLDGNGINVKSGATVSTSYPFNNCTFSGGGTGTLLILDNNQSLTIDGAIFPENTWGGTYNVAKTMNQGSVNFTNATGLFAGPLYENDSYNRINWAGDTPGLWTGTVSSDWNNIQNWHFSLKPTASDDATIPSGTPFSPSVSSASGNCNDLTIQSGALLTVNNNTLNVGNDMEVFGQLQMDHASGILNVGNDLYWRSGSSENITTGTINLDGDWWFDNGTSAQLSINNVVNFTGNSHQFIYCYDTDARFGDVVIDQTGATATWLHNTSTQPIYISGDLDILDYSFLQVQTEHLIVDGELSVWMHGDLYLEHTGGQLTNYSDHTLYGHINVDGGHVMIHGTFDVASSGELTLESGTFGYNSGNISNTIHGTVNISGGTYTAHETIWISSTGTLNMSGGVVSTRIGFLADNSGNFQPTGGVVEFKHDHVGAGAVSCTNGNYFHDIRIDCPSMGSGATLNSNIDVQGDVEILDGTIFIHEYNMDVSGDLNIYDRVAMDHALGQINAGNDVNWFAGSSESIVAGIITVDGDWHLDNGSYCNLHDGSSTNTVIFEGPQNSNIYSNSASSAFHDVVVNKPSPTNNTLTISGTQQLNILGTLTVDDGEVNMATDVNVGEN